MSLRRCLTVFLTNALLLLCGLLVVEFVARQLHLNRLQTYAKVIYVDDYGLNISAPNQDFLYHYEAYLTEPFQAKHTLSYRVITNAIGQRVSGQPGTHRKFNLAILGDSFSFGAHADYSQTLAGILAENLKDTNVLNYGVSGTSSDEYPKILRYFHNKDKARLDYVVIGLYVDLEIGDLPRRLAREKYGSYKSWDGVIVGPTKYSELKASSIAQGLFWAEIFLRSQFSLVQAFMPPRIHPEFAISMKNNLSSNVISEYKNHLIASLREIMALTKLPPQKILIWLVPSNHEANNKAYPGSFDQASTQLHHFSEEFWSRTLDQLSQQGLRVLDTRNAINNAVLAHAPYVFSVDGHLNAAGYRVVSNLMLPFIKGDAPEF